MKDLKRVLGIIRKTGDRYIFEDEEGNLFVILALNDYENIVLKNSQVRNLNEEELLNKINKDIAIWKASQKDRELEEIWQNLATEPEKKAENEEIEDQYYFEPTEDED